MPPAPGARHRLHPGPFAPGQGPGRAALADSAGPSRQRTAPAAHCHPRGRQCLPADLPRRLQPTLHLPTDPTAVWRRPPRDLDRFLSCRYPRRVARDNTVRLGPRCVQIPRGPRRALLRGLPRRTPRTPRWPAARLPPRPLSGHAAVAGTSLRPAAAQRPEVARAAVLRVPACPPRSSGSPDPDGGRRGSRLPGPRGFRTDVSRSCGNEGDR